MKSLRVIVTIFVAAVLCLPFCVVAGSTDKIVGTWESTVHGMTITWIFVPDGTLFGGMSHGSSGKGKWSRRNDMLRLEEPGGGGGETVKILHLDDTALVIESTNKAVHTFKRVK
jgi:hypothetical protein